LSEVMTFEIPGVRVHEKRFSDSDLSRQKQHIFPRPHNYPGNLFFTLVPEIERTKMNRTILFGQQYEAADQLYSCSLVKAQAGLQAFGVAENGCGEGKFMSRIIDGKFLRRVHADRGYLWFR